MKNVAVFCGSSPGFDPVYLEAAQLLGVQLAKAGIGIIYGGANVGLMGAVADGALVSGGQVIGVLPHFLQDKEIAHTGLSELILVDTMHERKQRMHALADGVIALPGGCGTLEEFFEILTWGQLGLHQQPMALYNVNGFYDPLLQMLSQMVSAGFLKQVYYDIVLHSDGVDDLLEQMHNYQPTIQEKWLSRDRT